MVYPVGAISCGDPSVASTARGRRQGRHPTLDTVTTCAWAGQGGLGSTAPDCEGEATPSSNSPADRAFRAKRTRVAVALAVSRGSHLSWSGIGALRVVALRPTVAGAIDLRGPAVEKAPVRATSTRAGA